MITPLCFSLFKHILLSFAEAGVVMTASKADPCGVDLDEGV